MKKLLLTLAAVLLFQALPAMALLDQFEFTDEAQELRYKDLIVELRCLVCQNQSLLDSDAELAQDLRVEVFEMMQAGQDDEQITDFLVERYGDFVLYNPPVKPSTWLLWYGPFVLLIIAALLLLRSVRRQKQTAATGISPEDRQRLDKVLGENRNERDTQP